MFFDAADGDWCGCHAVLLTHQQLQECTQSALGISIMLYTTMVHVNPFIRGGVVSAHHWDD